MTWLVKAILDLKGTPDCNAEAEFAVLIAPPGPANTAGELGNSNKPDEIGMALALPSEEWVMGETISLAQSIGWRDSTRDRVVAIAGVSADGLASFRL